MPKSYYVYILTNSSATVLYIGVTGNLAKRVDEHIAGVGSDFTSRYHTNRLLYFEEYHEIRDAIAREKQLKSWNRKKKEALISTMNPERLNLRPQLNRV